jgi:hypothetical protein
MAMVVTSVSGRPIRPEWMRLRATALQRVTLNSWAPRGAFDIPEYINGLIRPHGRQWRLANTIELQIELVRPRRYLFLPEGTVALSSPVAVRMDPSGGVALASRVPGPMVYTVWVAQNDRPRATDQPLEVPPRFDLVPEARQLALNIVDGIESDADKAAAIEAHLKQNYGYALSGMTQQRADPISWFLLHERQGHCEYFAGAMVALLSDLDIPARMVAGYSGGSLSLDGEEAVIRDANAHAWVEAWVGDDGTWTVFDPTPEADIPVLNRPTGRERLRWAVDWVQSSWDRYVLTFGFGEQVQLVTAMANGVEILLRRMPWGYLPLTLVVAVLLLVFWWAARHRRRSGADTRRIHSGPAAAALERVVHRLERFGVEVPPRATIRWISKQARHRWPAASSAIGELCWLAERELYAAEGPRFSDRATVRTLWRHTRRGMRQNNHPNEE